MKIKKVPGGFIQTILTVMLILVNAMTADGDELFDRTENPNASAAVQ